MDEYTIALSNTFVAESIEDAVSQFISWAEETAHSAGYRVSWSNKIDGVWQETSVFVDADRLWRD